MNEKKLNIVFVIARFWPYRGGAEMNCYKMATYCAALGHNVTVLTTDANPGTGILPSEETVEGVKIIRVHRWNQQLNLGFYPGLLSKLVKTKADVVHVENGPGFMWQDFCVLVKKWTSWKTKFIVTPHGPFLATGSTYTGLKGVVANLGQLLLAPYFKLIWGKMWHKVIAINARQPVWLARDYWVNPKNIVVIPNGIPAELLNVPYKHAEEGVLRISYLGRISEYKGVQKVIEALHILHATPAEYQFTVMGKMFYPELLEKIREYNLQEVVKIIDTPSDEVRDQVLTEESEIHILPSQWEAQGIVLLEAMAKGNIPVTTETNEGAPDFIQNGRNGFIYPYENAERLAQIIEQMRVATKLRQQMIDLNLQIVKNWTWEEILPKYQQLIKFLTNTNA